MNDKIRHDLAAAVQSAHAAFKKEREDLAEKQDEEADRLVRTIAKAVCNGAECGRIFRARSFAGEQAQERVVRAFKGTGVDVWFYGEVCKAKIKEPGD